MGDIGPARQHYDVLAVPPLRVPGEWLAPADTVPSPEPMPVPHPEPMPEPIPEPGPQPDPTPEPGPLPRTPAGRG